MTLFNKTVGTLFCLSTLYSFLFASEYAPQEAPWFGKFCLIETRNYLLFQNFSKVRCGDKNRKYSSNDLFYTLNGSLAYTDCFEGKSPLNGQFEITFANTSKQRPACDNLRATARMLLLNDVAGLDPISATIGFTATKAFKHSLKDISSFHHGRLEGELHLAVGKELDCHQFWISRVWARFGIGVGDHGSPWLRGDLMVERNFWDWHQFGIGVRSLWGLGNESLHVHDFSGYGPIHHQSIDVGVRYTYLMEYDINLTIEYYRRVLAHNFPAQANLVRATLFYPFNL